MEHEAAAKRMRLERHRGLSDIPWLSSFHMEDLPEEIQPRVLSLISLKEAVRTSIVSRNWKMIWTRHPNLCFDGTKTSPMMRIEDCVKIKREKFIKTVNSIIQQHSGIGLNKFSIRCSLMQKSSDHLDRWINFATAAKAKIININLWLNRITKQVYHFPLEALRAQDGPFVELLFLKDVSIKPHLDICGFTKLTRLHLHYVQINGDFPGLLLNCSNLEDLEVIACSGRRGCSKLEKATLMFKTDNKELWHAFTAIPTISAVKVLRMHAYLEEVAPVWASQVHMVAPKPTFMFMNLRRLTCEIKIYTKLPNSHSGLLQLAHYLAFVPQLETLQLHMVYQDPHGKCWQGEATGKGVPCMRRLDCLKKVYMSGFRCYRSQVELLCGILEKGPALEHVTIEPRVTPKCALVLNMLIPYPEIRQWASVTSERFGKVITVAPHPWL